MNPGFRLPRLGRRTVLIASAGLVIVAIGSGLGLYLASRAHPSQPIAARNVGPAPSVAPVGSTSLATPKAAVVLAVVKTSPGAGSVGNALDASITLDFNLAVDPVALNGFLGVVATGSANPTVAGTLAQGNTPQEVVFRPAASFEPDATVQVTLRSGLNSEDGSSLDSDYNFSFATVPDPRSVSFMSGDEQVRLLNAPSGLPVNMSIQSGAQVPAGVTLKTYRATVPELLAAFVYSSTGYPDKPIDTTSMSLVDSGGTSLTASGARTTVVQNNVAVSVNQPDGLYLIVAADSAGQYGAVWVDFSHFGILLRQDDQRVVVAGEDLATGATTAQFDITFYNLLNGVHAGASGSFTGTGEFPARFPAGFDLAVARSGGEDVVVPMAAPETNAAIRVVADLSQQPKIFLTTDRLAYRKGDSVRFAGVARLSNDQVYTPGAGLKLALWTYAVSGNLAVVTAAADGTFSGSFAIPAAAFNPDGTDASLTLHAGAVSASASSPYLSFASTSIVALGSHAPSGSLTVTLDKPSYVASDTIVATVSGVDAGGKPLAGQTLNLTVYASQHVLHPVETDNFPAPTSWGQPVLDKASVRLDATGHATYSVKANIAQKAADEEITVAATYGSGAALAVGARTAVVYQAAYEVFLLPGRSAYWRGDTVVAPFVVEARDGARAPNVPMAYEIDSTDYSGDRAITTVIASGTVKTDASGLGAVRASLSGGSGAVALRVKGADQSGNVFEDDQTLAVNLPNFGSFSGDTNPRLDVIADKIAYGVGDSAQLTVTSPAAETALLSLERGRVHLYRLIQLVKGDNPLTIVVTPDLAPGFSAVFSYIQGGEYTSQEFPVQVNNSPRLLKVTLTPDQPSYTRGQTARLTVAVVDAGGAAVASSLLADGYEGPMSAYRLVDQASIAGAFLSPDRTGTNGSSSLLGVGTWGGRCGGGEYGGPPDPTYAGQAVLWLPDQAVDASGHVTISVPLQATPVRLVVFASAPSGWGQAEIDLGVQ